MTFFLDADEFEAVVVEVFTSLPAEIKDAMENVAVLIEDKHPEEDLLGLYEGVALTERYDYFGALPDQITLYRLPLLAISQNEMQLRHEIQVTLVHEIGHHVGLSEEKLHELGWA